MGNLVANGQMRGDGQQHIVLKRHNSWSKKMTDLEKVLGQIMYVDPQKSLWISTRRSSKPFFKEACIS
jgi:hypothetical protein